MTQAHDIGHLVGRITGESLSHPRQRIVHWLKEHDLAAKISRFNELYEASRKRNEEDPRVAKDQYASYEAFLGVFGNHPDTETRWSLILDGKPA